MCITLNEFACDSNYFCNNYEISASFLCSVHYQDMNISFKFL